LGVPNADGVLEDIIKTIGESVAVTPIIVTVNGGRMTGGLRVEILRADYGDILGLPGASFPSEKHHQVDWLKWLLLEGGNAVIGDYHFFGSERLLGTSRAGRSLGRTGLGIMVPTGHWTVPEEFSGTATDNWLTRALSRTGPKAVAIMVEEIKRNLQ
jgi:hypothetical protein